ncbi:MAG TPA: ABC transporter ATP-binding protein [Burkholderiales bacterium]|jgi:branched-chain amino acid transport system ATP-binding protein|nr:ABC transporter ATP-binding protein [Burkholderiales bacterium]
MSSALLELRRVSAAYGRAQVLFGVDLALNAGEALVVLGRNGAGKTTTLKAIIGLLPCTSGEILFEGKRIDAVPSFEIARLGLGYVPEERRIFTGLTVTENLEVGRQPPRSGLPPWTPDKLFELFPNLGRMRERRGAEMSGGEQQMLAIARTLMGNPRAILLDEPFEGLAPRIVEAMAAAVRALKSEGLAVLLCEQNPRYAALVADRALTLQKGRIRAEPARAA